MSKLNNKGAKVSKKIKIQITSWLNGTVLFEYKSENNTVAKTLEEAVKNSANLRSADLGSADLRYANLRSADLGSADLRYANLGYADLRSANLGYANLGSADLRYANLGSANLGSADLRYANLGYADLGSANLGSANLRYAENADWAIALTRILPEGDIIGWKKCKDDKIVKLLIPKDAKRSHAFGRKCRAEYAEVLEVTKGARQLKTAKSTYDDAFIYKVGDIVKPKSKFSEEWTDECASGIHFFITKVEAEKHEY